MNFEKDQHTFYAAMCYNYRHKKLLLCRRIHLKQLLWFPNRQDKYILHHPFFFFIFVLSLLVHQLHIRLHIGRHFINSCFCQFILQTYLCLLLDQVINQMYTSHMHQHVLYAILYSNLLLLFYYYYYFIN